MKNAAATKKLKLWLDLYRSVITIISDIQNGPLPADVKERLLEHQYEIQRAVVGALRRAGVKQRDIDAISRPQK